MSTPSAGQGETYAVVNGEYLLPFEAAVDMLRALKDARRVSQTWNSTAPYRLNATPKMPNIEVLTTAQYGAIFLEEPA